MAWQTGYDSRSYRKEASKALRGESNRAAMSDPEKLGKRKRVNCNARKFGLEYKWRKEDMAVFLWATKGWQRYWAKYETARQRDQALESMNRKNDHYEYRAIDL